MSPTAATIASRLAALDLDRHSGPAAATGTFADFIRTVSPTFGFYRHVAAGVLTYPAACKGA